MEGFIHALFLHITLQNNDTTVGRAHLKTTAAEYTKPRFPFVSFPSTRKWVKESAEIP